MERAKECLEGLFENPKKIWKKINEQSKIQVKGSRVVS